MKMDEIPNGNDRTEMTERQQKTLAGEEQRERREFR